ncbi:peptidylprolyl isomerase [Clostridium sp.]|uniref:peptidylprolyl isomerase n=1 Tax=Clostridium sp. TaxID=1506 RepID=UPI0032179232
MKNPIATMAIKNGSKIMIELMPKEAPNAVNCFIYLAQKGLFDNREIKRIAPNFVLQPTYDSFGRDPECNVALNGEFRENGINNNLKIEKGIVALGGDGEKMSAGSCFFITLSDEAGKKLNGKFTGFGKIIEGFAEVERIVSVETKSIDVGIEGVIVNEPVIPEIIESITIETFGEEYDEPIIIGIAD